MDKKSKKGTTIYFDENYAEKFKKLVIINNCNVTQMMAILIDNYIKYASTDPTIIQVFKEYKKRMSTL